MGYPHFTSFSPHNTKQSKYGRQPTVEKYYSEAVHNLYACVFCACPVCAVWVSVSICLVCLNYQCQRWAQENVQSSHPSLQDTHWSHLHTLTHANLTSHKRSSMWDWHSCHMFRGRNCLYQPSGTTFSLLNHSIRTQTSWHCYDLCHTLSLEMQGQITAGPWH